MSSQPEPRTEDATKLVRIAAAFAADQDWEAAEGAAELAAACDPQSFEAWSTLGALRARQKNYERAIPCYVKALELAPNDIQSWTDLGELFTLMMDYEKAAAALRQAMTLDPKAEHPGGRRARAIVGRTLALLKKK